MDLGKGQDHLADELALGRGQLQESIKRFALQKADAFVPALLVLLHLIAHGFAKAQHLGFDF